MPEINNEDLLSLHYQIEKAEVEQNKLETLLNDKTVELKNNRASKFLLKILCSVLFITTVSLLIYSKFGVSKEQYTKNEVVVESMSFTSEINMLKKQLEKIRTDKIDLRDIQDLYLYRKLIQKDTVYSVQIQSFTDKNVALISEKYTNARFYNDTSYYKFSLGIFESLKEAQEFRNVLIRSSVIDKNIFVISYKNGKRIRIENPF